VLVPAVTEYDLTSPDSRFFVSQHGKYREKC
jgi:hypothetical protein